MGLPRLAILHVSDLHFEAATDWRRRRVLGDAWTRNLDAFLEQGKLDLVCFTGDLAKSGKAEEYAALTPFVEALLEHTRVPRERLFVVPGNHDVDRSVSRAAWNELRALEGDDLPALSRWMAGGKPPRRVTASWPDQVMERARAYRAWVHGALGRPELVGGTLHPRLGYRVSVPGLGFPLHVVGLDSPASCGSPMSRSASSAMGSRGCASRWCIIH